MKTHSYSRSLSLSLSLSLILIGSSLTLNAQTVKVPTGLVGNSNNGNMGVGIATPTAKLDVQTDPATGALLLRTAAGEFFGGGYQTTPFALHVQHTEPDINNNPQTTTTAKMLASGVLTLGNIGGFNPTRFLNVPAAGLGVYNSATNAITLTYGNSPGLPAGPTLSWTGTGQNYTLAFGNSAKLVCTPQGQLTSYSAGTANTDFAFTINSGLGSIVRVADGGSVYIGEGLNYAYFDEYRLYVEKGIRAERVRVDIAANNGWADFVFEDDYTLMPVAELEAFIKKYKHLPNVPSAAQVQAEGIDLAEMNAILLRQIEELTLRVIELEKGLVED